MGSSSSKVDTYVLAVDESKKRPSAPNILDTSPVFAERKKIERRGSTSNLSEPSSSPVVPLKARANSTLGVTTPKLSRGTSFQASSGGKKSIAVKCSAKYPWLVKQADFSTKNIEDFEFGRIIGRGLMGTVRVCKTKNDKYFVMKAISKDFIVKHRDERHIKNEKEILYSLNCSFCVKLFGTFQDRTNVYFALEYVPGGELFHRLGRKQQFTPPVAKFYSSEIFVALEHIQSLDYVYRDLKPENIVLDEEGHVKLIDFGFSTRCGADSRMHTLCGTPAYLSPEQLDGKLTNGYTRVVDWWSYGVLIYELLTGKTPFCKNNRESHYEVFLRILKSKIYFPFQFDSRSKELISSLCHPKVEKRLCDATLIKNHPYFEIDWVDVAERRLIPPFVPRFKDNGDSHYFNQHPEPKELKKAESERSEYLDF